MLKALGKAIMHRSKLKNIYNKYRTDDNWANYKKQRNFCVNLFRETKKIYQTAETFGETIKPIF